MTTLCDVVRSSRRHETYLYLTREQGMEAVPEALQQQFGEPVPVMTLALKPGRKLARAKVEEVLAALEQSGYYLQMPPVPGARRDV